METLIDQLRDSDPHKRKAAIMGLANLKDPAALKHLAEVYKNDPNPELRQLAYKAGTFIKKSVEEAARPAPPVEVSEKDQQRAQMFLDRAVNYHMNRKKAQAVENLAKAFELNPKLKSDPVANGLASELMQRRPEEAVQLLMNESARETIKQQARQVTTQQRQAEASKELENAVLFVAAYFIVLFVGLVILLMLLTNVFPENVEDVVPTTNTAAISDLEGATAVVVLVIALIYAISQTISLIIQSGAIHIVAKMMFVGNGSYFGFLQRISIFQMVVWIVAISVYSLLIIAPGGSTFSVFILTFGFGGIFALYYFVQMVSKYYGFGNCAGCMAIIGGGILLFVAQVIFGFLLTFVLEGFA